MKRRDFIVKSTTGALAAGMAGCSGGIKHMDIHKTDIRYSDYNFEPTLPKPAGGTLPMKEIGTTGIKIPQFGFGSHMRNDIIHNFSDRQRIIRGAYDYGVRLFDVYDKEHECYQYEPMGKHLKPMINDVAISIALLPYDGRTFEQEFERDLRAFGRDHIDLVRIHVRDPESKDWDRWEQLFKWKEQGKIRAVGVPIHNVRDLDKIIDVLPLDFVLFPYNFYHNIVWHGHEGDNYETLPKMLRRKGIGVLTMKAFAGDPLQAPFRDIADKLNDNPDIDYNRAALKFVINSPVDPDATVTGMYNMDHLYNNLSAYFDPEMTPEEAELLEKVRKTARIVAKYHLPKHYEFLENWAYAESSMKKFGMV